MTSNSSNRDEQKLAIFSNIVKLFISSKTIGLVPTPIFLTPNCLEPVWEVDIWTINGFESDFKSWPFDIAHNNSELILNMTRYNHTEYIGKISQYHKGLVSYENYNATKNAVNVILSLWVFINCRL